MLRQTSVPTVIDSFYLVTLGSYRFFYILNWLVRGIGEGYFDPTSVIFGIIQTALYIDFAWVYWSRQRVKLRGGGVVDSDDLSKSFLVRRLIGRRGNSEDEEVDEDPEALSRQENGTINNERQSAGRTWGARGVSVSADDTLAAHERPGAQRQQSYTDHGSDVQEDAQPMADPAAFEDDDSDADAPPPPAKDSAQQPKKENQGPIERSETPAEAVGSSAGEWQENNGNSKQ